MAGFARRNAVTGDRVALRLPAVSAYLSVLRTATSALAARMNFPLDEIEDLRIAVDEACVMLMSAALPGADMEVEFVLAGDAMEVAVTVPTLTGVQPATDTFSWTVLCALTEAVRSQVGSDNRVTIKLRKRRVVGCPAGESP
ncbi:MAG: ATP-binding protein [Frankiaceae bacterium]